MLLTKVASTRTFILGIMATNFMRFKPISSVKRPTSTELVSHTKHFNQDPQKINKIIHQTENIQVTDNIGEIKKSKRVKMVRIFWLKECNNNEEKNKSKVKPLSSEIAIKNFKTYLDLIDSEHYSCLMNKHIVAIHELNTKKLK